MKKYRILLLIIMILSLIFATACSHKKSVEVELKSKNTDNMDKSWEVITERGYINVGISCSELPYIQKYSNTAYDGFLDDFIHEIVKKYGLDVKYVEVEQNNVTHMLNDGTIDLVLNGYSQSDVENSSTRWSEPYLSHNHIIVCTKDSEISTKEDLADKKIGVVKNSSVHIAAQSDVKIDKEYLVEYETESEALYALSQKTIDALVTEDATFYFYKNKAVSNYVILDEIISTHIHSIGFNKANDTLADKITASLKELKANGTIKELSEKWFNFDFTK